MCKNSSQERGDMHRGVAEAREWSSWLVQRELRGNGDLPNAMRRIERRYGIPFGVLHSLRYRPPKDILLSLYEKIRDAYLVDLERQKNALIHEAALVRAAIRVSENVARPTDPQN